MPIRNYLTITISLVFVALQCVAARGVVVEPARSEILPFNSDSLYVAGGVTGSSLFVDPIEEWKSDGNSLYSHYIFPFEWLNRQVLLRIDYVAAPYRVEINGEVVAKCSDGNSPIEYDITLVTAEGMNSIAIHLDRNTEVSKIEGWSGEPRTKQIGEVSVIAPSKMNIRDIDIRTKRHENSLSAEIAVAIKSYNLNYRRSTLKYELRSPSGGVLLYGHEDISLSMRGEDTLYISTIIPDTVAWSAQTPNLCQIEMNMEHDSWMVEYHRYNIGLRSVGVTPAGDMLINGYEVTLTGVSVDHQIAMEDLLYLKNSGRNMVLLGAGVATKELLDMCDSVGLYVIVTAPINSSKSGEDITAGSNITNNPAWRERYESRALRSYHSVKRHPSVVAFAIAEESLNGCNLYDVYLRLKSLERDLPIIYRDAAGEWNSDKLNLIVEDGY